MATNWLLYSSICSVGLVNVENNGSSGTYLWPSTWQKYVKEETFYALSEIVRCTSGPCLKRAIGCAEGEPRRQNRGKGRRKEEGGEEKRANVIEKKTDGSVWKERKQRVRELLRKRSMEGMVCAEVHSSHGFPCSTLSLHTLLEIRFFAFGLILPFSLRFSVYDPKDV